jgi:hypothetical protein
MSFAVQANGEIETDGNGGSVQLTEGSFWERRHNVAFQANGECGYTAPWLRHMLREITAVDFPTSWCTGDAPRRGIPEGRSHDSRVYGRRFMLRLDEPTREMLEHLSRHFKKSSAEIIRQLVAQATPEALPVSWHLAVGEHRQQGDA